MKFLKNLFFQNPDTIFGWLCLATGLLIGADALCVMALIFFISSDRYEEYKKLEAKLDKLLEK